MGDERKYTLVVRVKHDRNSLGNPNGLRLGQTLEVTRTKRMFLANSRWHIEDDFEVIGRKAESDAEGE